MSEPMSDDDTTLTLKLNATGAELDDFVARAQRLGVSEIEVAALLALYGTSFPGGDTEMTATDELTALPDTGVFTVKTEHSTYTVDMDAMVFRRVNDSGDNPRFRDGGFIHFDAINCEVQNRMAVLYGGGDTGLPPCRRVTTTVVSIARAEGW